MSTTSITTRHPEILWAQRSNKVFLTVELPDAKDAQVKVEPDGQFTFIATTKDAKYETTMQLYAGIKADESKITQGRRHTVCVLQKQDMGWWDRLLQKEGKAPPFVKADWNHWIDEDEEGESVGADDFNMNMSDMGAMDDNYPQMEPIEDSDDEDDDAPDLQKAEA